MSRTCMAAAAIALARCRCIAAQIMVSRPWLTRPDRPLSPSAEEVLAPMQHAAHPVATAGARSSARPPTQCRRSFRAGFKTMCWTRYWSCSWRRISFLQPPADHDPGFNLGCSANAAHRRLDPSPPPPPPTTHTPMSHERRLLRSTHASCSGINDAE